jgi:hypothetical protein
MVTKVIALNTGGSEHELKLREDIAEACEGIFELKFVDSNDLWIEAKTNNVQIMSPRGAVELGNVFFLIRLRKQDSALVALLCHILKLSGVGYTDESNEYHSDFAEKSFAIPRLAIKGFLVPDTIIVSYKSLLKNIVSVEKSFVYPCVVKGKGDRGESVELAHNREELLDFAERANKKNPALISIQARIENTYDVRALFFGETCLGAIRRMRGVDQPLLNNVSKGAAVEVDEITTEEISLCRQVMEISYVDFCGIDFIRTNEGLVFIELNRAPQLGGIRGAIPSLSVGKGLVSLIRKIDS